MAVGSGTVGAVSGWVVSVITGSVSGCEGDVTGGSVAGREGVVSGGLVSGSVTLEVVGTVVGGVDVGVVVSAFCLLGVVDEFCFSTAEGFEVSVLGDSVGSFSSFLSSITDENSAIVSLLCDGSVVFCQVASRKVGSVSMLAVGAISD